MAEKISWEECVKQAIIIKIPPDDEKSKQIMDMAMLRLEFWENKIDERFTVLKIEAYYEIIKELTLSLIYKEGYNCINHQCLIAYLTNNVKGFDYEINKIDELRQIRNEIAYRGFKVNANYLKRNELEFKGIITQLKGLIER